MRLICATILLCFSLYIFIAFKTFDYVTIGNGAIWVIPITLFVMAIYFFKTRNK